MRLPAMRVLRVQGEPAARVGGGGGHLGELGGATCFSHSSPDPRLPVCLFWLTVTLSHEPSRPDMGPSCVGETGGGRSGENHVAGGVVVRWCWAAVAVALPLDTPPQHAERVVSSSRPQSRSVIALAQESQAEQRSVLDTSQAHAPGGSIASWPRHVPFCALGSPGQWGSVCPWLSMSRVCRMVSGGPEHVSANLAVTRECLSCLFRGQI